jgi:hypothetical protein
MFPAAGCAPNLDPFDPGASSQHSALIPLRQRGFNTKRTIL